jgi:CubicO group peptidase (beta-lactamase class C family)
MKTLVKIAIGLLVIIGLFFLIAPANLRRFVLYTTADLDDYTIFENREVKAGQPQPWRLHPQYNQLKIGPQHLQAMQELQTVAFLVIQDTAIVHEQYWDGYSDHSLSNSFSIAKSIVGLLIGIALDEGKIKSLDQKVSEFIPEYATGENAQLRLKDLLTMSSGLEWDENYINPFSHPALAYYGEDLHSLVTGLHVVKKPGEEFAYVSGNTQLLALVLKKATGMHPSEYASKKLWQPLGAQYPALWSTDTKDGIEKAYCCFNSNARDFARLGQLVLNKGKWNDKQIVSQKYMQETIQPVDYVKNQAGKPVDFYGYHWWLIDYKGYHIPFAWGLLSQYIFVIPEKNAVVVRLGHKSSPEWVGTYQGDVTLYIDAALQILEDKKAATCPERLFVFLSR